MIYFSVFKESAPPRRLMALRFMSSMSTVSNLSKIFTNILNLMEPHILSSD